MIEKTELWSKTSNLASFFDKKRSMTGKIILILTNIVMVMLDLMLILLNMINIILQSYYFLIY